MTEEQINIAIAESLGIHFESSTGCWHQKGSGYLAQRPNYTASLDACAEFEAVLADSDASRSSRWRYIEELIEITGAEWMEIHRNVFTVVHATAPQRCEAYLRAIEKWEASA